MSENKPHLTTIETDSLYRIMSDRAFWRGKAERVTAEAEAADQEWRQELGQCQTLRLALHEILGVNPHQFLSVEMPLSDKELLDGLRAKLRTSGLRDGSALSSVDMPVRTIKIDGVDITGFVSEYKINTDTSPLTTEQSAILAAGVGGRAAAMVDAMTEQAERTVTVAPVDQPDTSAPRIIGLTGRQFHTGDIIGAHDVPAALATPTGEVWDWAGSDDHQNNTYANEDRTQVLTFSGMLHRFGAVYEVITPDQQCPSLQLYNGRLIVCVERGRDHVTHVSDAHDPATNQRINTWTDAQAVPSPWPLDREWEPDPGIDVLHDPNSRSDRCYLRRISPHHWAWQTTPDGSGENEIDQIGSDWSSAVCEADGDLVVMRP